MIVDMTARHPGLPLWAKKPGNPRPAVIISGTAPKERANPRGDTPAPGYALHRRIPSRNLILIVATLAS